MYDLFMISFITDLLIDIVPISDSLSECKMLLPNITVDLCEKSSSEMLLELFERIGRSGQSKNT